MLSLASDGSGSASTSPSTAITGTTGNIFTITYTATEDMQDGGLLFTPSTTWSMPQTTSGIAGYTTATTTGVFGTSTNSLDSTTGWSDNSLFITLSSDTSIKKQGSGSLKAAITASVGSSSIYYDYASPQDWSSYTKMSFWFRSSISLTAGSFSLMTSESASLASPTRYTIPSSIFDILQTDTWTHVTVDLPVASSSARDAIRSYGFEIPVSALANFYFDNIMIGPSVPMYSSQSVEVHFVSLSQNGTVAFTYGATGGASGVTTATTTETSTLALLQKVYSGGSYTSLASPPSVVLSYPTIQFSFTTSSASEASSSISLLLQLQASTSLTSTVQYSAQSSSTATGLGTDFTLTTGTSTIGAGNTTTSISLSLTNDSLYESSETVVIRLASPVYSSLGSTVEHTFTILDNDTAPSIQFSNATSSQSESSTTLDLVLQLSAVSGVTTTVQYSIAASTTATSGGVDFTLSNGTSTISAGNTTTSISVSIVNDSLDEDDEFIIITLENPANSSLGSTTQYTYTLVDNDSAPTISFSLATSTVSEGTATSTTIITLSASSSKIITVQYSAVASSTATGSGTDYALSNGTSTISAGNTTTSISVSIINDSSVESTEIVVIDLANPSNATLTTPSEHVLSITDNDTYPQVFFVSSTASGTESTTTSTLTLQLSATSSESVALTIATSGTAIYGTEYTLGTTTVIIAAGSATTSLSITISNDSIDESDETIILTISTSTNSTIGSTSTYTYTITDDDATPTISFSLATSSVSEATATATLLISLSASSSFAVTAQYSSQSSSTATGSGTDFTLSNGTSTISAGNTTTSISVSIVNDSTVESSETIVVRIGTSTNATLTNPIEHIVTIADNDVPDSTPPVISQTSTSVSTSSVIVTWTTDEAASSQVEYGLTPSNLTVSTTESDTSTRVTSHSVSISGLSICTSYYYRVRGSDSASNFSTSTITFFTTTGCTGSASVSAVTSTLAATSTETTLIRNSLTLTIPVGYNATSAAVFQIKSIDSNSLLGTIDANSGVSLIENYAFNLQAFMGISSTLSSFRNSLTVSIQYEDSEISNVTESSLRILRYNNSWHALSSCSVNTSSNIVTCTTTNFSDFGLFGETLTSNNNSNSTSGGGSSIPSYLVYNILGAKEDEISTSTTHLLQKQLYIFNINLKLNDTKEDVLRLQKFLNENGFVVAETGYGSRNQETTFFGPKTKQALIRFQEAHKREILLPIGLNRGTGRFGPNTRKFVNGLLIK